MKFLDCINSISFCLLNCSAESSELKDKFNALFLLYLLSYTIFWSEIPHELEDSAEIIA